MALDDDAAGTLTTREIEVLTLTVRGLSAKEIAKELSIAPRTVEGHIDHIKIKTRTRNRPHMIAFAIGRGIV